MTESEAERKLRERDEYIAELRRENARLEYDSRPAVRSVRAMSKVFETVVLLMIVMGVVVGLIAVLYVIVSLIA